MEYCYSVKLLHCGNINLANENDTAQKNVFYMPMGFFALASVLKNNGFDVEILHSDLIDNELNLRNVDAVGLDCHWINQSLNVIETAQYIKNRYPNIYIFIGGYSASLYATEILKKYPQIDAVIRGDGEIPIRELCEALKIAKQCNSKYELNDVQNLVWKDINGAIVENPFSYIGTEESFSNLDYASLELLRGWEDYQYFSTFWTGFLPLSKSPMFLLEIGRGCSYACTFCGGNCEAQYIISNRKGYSVRTIDSVIETIKKAISYGYETFYTCFEFENSNEYFIKLFNRLTIEGIRINFIYGSWGLPSKHLLDTMSNTCNEVMLEISPESNSENLRILNKDKRIFYTNKQLEECLDYVNKKNNIKVQIYFGYYMAGDTMMTIIDTIRYILQLLLIYSNIVEIEYSNFSTDPASLLYLHPKKYNVEMNVNCFEDYLKQIKNKYILKNDLSADMRIFKPNNITDVQNNEIEKMLKLLNYLFVTFKSTVSFILKNTNSIELIMKIISESNVYPIQGYNFNLDEVKKSILDSCLEDNYFTPELMRILNSDYINAKTKKYGTKSVPKISLN